MEKPILPSISLGSSPEDKGDRNSKYYSDENRGNTGTNTISINEYNRLEEVELPSRKIVVPAKQSLKQNSDYHFTDARRKPIKSASCPSIGSSRRHEDQQGHHSVSSRQSLNGESFFVDFNSVEVPESDRREEQFRKSNAIAFWIESDENKFDGLDKLESRFIPDDPADVTRSLDKTFTKAKSKDMVNNVRDSMHDESQSVQVTDVKNMFQTEITGNLEEYKTYSKGELASNVCHL